MSLATRCGGCGTVFRVVQDQLRVSEGWVRCGRCDAVFNAFEDLLDLERDGPVETKGSVIGKSSAGTRSDAQTEDDAAAARIASLSDDAEDLIGTGNADGVTRAQGAINTADTADVVSAVGVVSAVDATETINAANADETDAARIAAMPDASHAESEGAAQASSDPLQGDSAAPHPAAAAIDDEIDAHLFGHRHRGAPRDVDQRDRLDFSDARFDSELSSDALFEMPAADEAALPDAAEAPLEGAATPEFLRRAERRARWQSRRVRAALGAATLLLIATLALQAAHHFRDSLAARWPQARPLFAAWCGVTGCSIEAPRSIDEISVESTALTRAAGLDAFRLAVMLRSHSALPLALPSVELSLTDASGQLVARRALAPADFRVAQAVLPPGAELPLQLLLDARGSAVTGYTVEIFYP
jgi:predicted Zn finger-like uncharacterized protein